MNLCRYGQNLKGRALFLANIQGAPAGLITQGMLIRPLSAIKKGWRIRYNGQTYEVLHVDNSVPREMMLTTQDIQK